MKINELKCAASLEGGLMHLEDGTCINLALLYTTLAELREYASNVTLEDDYTPSCAYAADALLEEFQ